MKTYNVHAGHCPQGKGASGAVGYLQESVEDRIVKNEIIRLLRSAGHTTYDCTDDTNCGARQNLYNIVSKCNAHTVDEDCSIHLNAGGGKGVEVWLYNNRLEGMAKLICENVSKALNIPNRGVKYSKNLYVLHHTNAPAFLVECCFVDSESDFKLWKAKTCAKAIVEGMLGRKLKNEEIQAVPKFSEVIVLGTGTNGLRAIKNATVRELPAYGASKGTLLEGEHIHPSKRTVGGQFSDYWFKTNKGWICASNLDGWVQDTNGRWWFIRNGKCLKNVWCWVSGNCYYFGNDGYMVTDKYIWGAEGLCYVDKRGVWTPDRDIKRSQVIV